MLARRQLRAGLALVVVGSPLVPAAAAHTTTGLGGFHTPNWAAQCVVAEDVTGGASPLVCWTPGNGFTVRMGPAGRVAKAYLPRHRGFRDRIWAKRLLGFGHYWGFSVTYAGRLYQCKSELKGVTCWNAAGHGWWLGRDVGHRIF